MHKALALALAVSGSALIASPAFAATALFAGGCFWSIEANFEKVTGVSEAVSGFAGGHVDNPTYDQVAYQGGTGHYEVVEVTYDPAVVSYDQLLTVFWHSTDPTDAGGQFCDRGDTYRHAIFALDADQAAAAEASMAALEAESGYDFMTEIREPATFWPADAYHQDFAETNPLRYEAYRIGCGRDNVIAQLWGEDAFLGTSVNPFR